MCLKCLGESIDLSVIKAEFFTLVWLFKRKTVSVIIWIKGKMYYWFVCKVVLAAMETSQRFDKDFKKNGHVIQQSSF